MIRLLRGLVLISVLALPATSVGFARTWIVDAAGGGDFTRIGDACLGAADGDTVAIQPGNYDEYDGPEHNLIVREKSLLLLGLGLGPDDVRARISLNWDQCSAVVIEGITFHDEHSPVRMMSSIVTVRRCRFLDNVTSDGGGAIRAQGSVVMVEDCEFLRNRATGDEYSSGGAIVGGVIARRCRFEDNEATYKRRRHQERSAGD
jgi:predicted outer membrane repeat protein